MSRTPSGDLYSEMYETNPLSDEMRERIQNSTETVYWNDERLRSIDRLRLLTDAGFPFYDVSYCVGTLKDGRPCRVSLPFSQLSKGKGKITAEILALAKEDGVFAKGLGIFKSISILR